MREFILARSDATVPSMLTAQPTSILPAMLLSYRFFDMDNVADVCLRDLDHTTMNLYVPQSVAHFHQEEMEGGTNYTYEVGHHVFSVEDLFGEFLTVAADIMRDPLLVDPVNALAALYASLLWPDRVAWHVMIRPLGLESKLSAERH